MAANPSVDKLLRDAEQLAHRMRKREETVEGLLSKASELHIFLRTMRQCQESRCSFSQLRNLVEGNPRQHLILCLAVENKQIEELRRNNAILENSLSEHQDALELIMTKYREQVSTLMRTSMAETRLQPAGHRDLSPGGHEHRFAHPVAAPSRAAQPASTAADRLILLAAVAQEMTEQSDCYAAQLMAEVRCLESENAGLRDLLRITPRPAEPQQLPEDPPLDALTEEASLSRATPTINLLDAFLEARSGDADNSPTQMVHRELDLHLDS